MMGGGVGEEVKNVLFINGYFDARHMPGEKLCSEIFLMLR